MGLQAAEQLVTEFAASRVGMDFKTTEDQNELNIPPFLVYLLGIVIAEDEYHRFKEGKPEFQKREPSHHFSPEKEKRFVAFQKKYSAFANDASVAHSDEKQRMQSSFTALASQSYKLTTRMFPSKDQQALVKRDLIKECEKLEYISNKALESLLIEELSSSLDQSTKQNRGKKKKKKSKNEPQLITETKVKNTTVKDTESGENNCNQVKDFATTTHLSCVDNRSVEESPSSSWIEVKTKRNGEKKKNYSPLSTPITLGNKSLPLNRLNPSIVTKTEVGDLVITDDALAAIKNTENIYTSLPNHCHEDGDGDAFLTYKNSSAENKGAIITNLSSPPPLPSENIPSLNLAGDRSSLCSPVIGISEVAKQTQRLIDLEKHLADAKHKLIKERLGHTKRLRNEKERYESLIQALQLRLYISENKLRMYEEALEKHSDAVSAINSSRGGNAKNSNGEERIPSSPSLISKVLEKNKSNGKSVDLIW